MADISNNDAARIAKAIFKEMERFVGRGKSGGSQNTQGHSVAGSVTRNRGVLGDYSDVKLTSKSFTYLNKELENLRKNIDNYDDSIAESTKKYNDLIKQQSALTKSYINHDKMINSQQDKYKKELQDTLKNMSLFGKDIVELTYDIRTLGETLDKTDNFLQDFNDNLDILNETTEDEIDSKQRQIDALRDSTKSLDMESETRKKVMALSIDSTASEIEAAKESVKTQRNNAKLMRDESERLAEYYAVQSNALTNLTAVTLNLRDAMGLSFLGQLTTFIGAVGLIGSSIKQAYDEMWKSSNYGLGGAYNVLGGTLRSMTKDLGVSFEGLLKELKTNANIASQLGLEGTSKLIGANKSALMSIGLMNDEAMKAALGFARASQEAGIDPSDTENMNKAIRTQAKTFDTLNAITDITLDQFIAQNESLLKSTELRESMSRMDKTQRALVLQNIMMERERLAVMGLSNEQTLEFIKTAKGLSVDTVEKRFKQANAVARAYSLAGQGAKGMELRNLIIKGDRITPEEEKRRNQLLMGLGPIMQELKTGGLAMEHAANEIGNIDGNAGRMIQMGVEAGLAKAKSISASEVKDKKELTKVDPGIRDLLQKAKQWINDPLVKILAGVGTIVGLMLWNRKVLGRYLSRAIPKAGVGIKEKVGSGVKKTSTFARSVGSGAKSGVGKVASGIGKGAKFAGGLIGSAVSGIGALGKGALKALPGIGGAIMFMDALYSGFQAVDQANEIFNTEAATLSQKISAGIGGAVNSLTFGLIDTSDAAHIVDDGLTAAADFASSAWSKIKEIYKNIIPNLSKAKEWATEKLSTGIENAVNFYKFMWNNIKKIGNLYVDGIKSSYNWLKEKILSVVTWIGDIANGVKDYVAEKVSNAWNNVKTVTSNTVDNILDAINPFSSSDEEKTKKKISKPAKEKVAKVVAINKEKIKAEEKTKKAVEKSAEEQKDNTVENVTDISLSEQSDLILMRIYEKVSELVEITYETSELNKDDIKFKRLESLSRVRYSVNNTIPQP